MSSQHTSLLLISIACCFVLSQGHSAQPDADLSKCPYHTGNKPARESIVSIVADENEPKTTAKNAHKSDADREKDAHIKEGQCSRPDNEDVQCESAPQHDNFKDVEKSEPNSENVKDVQPDSVDQEIKGVQKSAPNTGNVKDVQPDSAAKKEIHKDVQKSAPNFEEIKDVQPDSAADQEIHENKMVTPSYQYELPVEAIPDGYQTQGKVIAILEKYPEVEDLLKVEREMLKYVKQQITQEEEHLDQLDKNLNYWLTVSNYSVQDPENYLSVYLNCFHLLRRLAFDIDHDILNHSLRDAQLPHKELHQWDILTGEHHLLNFLNTTQLEIDQLKHIDAHGLLSVLKSNPRLSTEERVELLDTLVNALKTPSELDELLDKNELLVEVKAYATHLEETGHKDLSAMLIREAREKYPLTE